MFQDGSVQDVIYKSTVVIDFPSFAATGKTYFSNEKTLFLTMLFLVSVFWSIPLK